MKLIIHRGAEEIGGNCIELQSKNSRILLDYGSPLPKKGETKPKTKPAGILNIPGLFENCARPINGLLISHTHQDHFGMLFEKPINQQIPVYMTPLMEDIIRITGKMIPGHRELKANILHFKKDEPFTIGDFKVTPYLMDHSAAEAFAFLIEAEGKKVLYSGDFREHGHKNGAFKSFMNRIPANIDLALIEGTMMGRESEGEKSEKDVLFEIKAMAEHSKGPVFVMCSGQNIDLITSLAGIADKTKRYLLIDAYVSLLLERIKKHLSFANIPCLEKEYLKIMPLRLTDKIKTLGYIDEYNNITAKLVNKAWLEQNNRRCIVPIRAWSEPWIKKYFDLKESVFIYSMWEGYLEEPSFQKTTDFFQKQGIEKINIHASGHAFKSTLKKLINKIKPNLLIPIHTEHADDFKTLFISGIKVKKLANGEEFEF